MPEFKAKETEVKILIVDDEESILQLFVNILKPQHIKSFPSKANQYLTFKPSNGKILEVFLCHNVDEALKAFANYKQEPFALTFLDINLGKDNPDGIYLAKALRKLDQEVEIVLITADSDVNLNQIATEIPPKDKLFFLNKPFKSIEIKQFVNALSEKWYTERKLKYIQLNLENIVKSRTEELMRANQSLQNEINERKRVEEALRQSEENFKFIITENADPIIIIDFNGKIQFVNPAAERAFGIEAEKLLQTDFEYPLLPGEKSEITIRKNAQETLICEMHVSTTEWKGKKAFLASLRDITERKILEERLWAILEKNQLVMKSTIQVIARFLEMKDPYTAGHQRRVSELALEIADKLGLNDHDREGIYMAAMIHDIGKISIPSEILSKPGKLSEIEYDLIKTHPSIGYDILKEIEFPWPLAAIVLQHHEKLDGSGYPLGIRDEEILFLTRILTVADVMEAIVSHRPYRASLGAEKGLEHLKTFSGKLYDPLIVDICVKIFNNFNFHFKACGLQERETFKSTS